MPSGAEEAFDAREPADSLLLLQSISNRVEHVSVVSAEIPFRNRRDRTGEPFDDAEGQEIENGMEFLGKDLFLESFNRVRVGWIGSAPEMVDLGFRSGGATGTYRNGGRLGNGCLFAFSHAKRLLVVDNLHELGLVVRREGSEVATEKVVINESPHVLVIPEELALHEGFKIVPSNMEANHIIKMAGETHTVYGDRDLHGG